MKIFNFDKVWVGFLLGLMLPVFVLLMVHQYRYSYMQINEFVKYIKLVNNIVALDSLSIVINLGVFFPFIWTGKNNGAKGVLISTLIWAAVVISWKYFA